jgi:hypothetical protein
LTTVKYCVIINISRDRESGDDGFRMIRYRERKIIEAKIEHTRRLINKLSMTIGNEEVIRKYEKNILYYERELEND